MSRQHDHQDGGKNIVAGNERVLRARLSDAKFFWDQDKKRRSNPASPSSRTSSSTPSSAPSANVSNASKRLAGEIAEIIGADKKKAWRAAYLCKADLVSGIVGEFPEVQGVMGRYYALHDKEDRRSRRRHPRPLQTARPQRQVPSANVSIAVALADKTRHARSASSPSTRSRPAR